MPKAKKETEKKVKAPKAGKKKVADTTPSVSVPGVKVTVTEIPKGQPIPEVKQTITIKAELPKEQPKAILWLTVAFQDGTLWKFPSAIIIRKAQSLGQSISNTDKEALLKYATDKMTWQEIRMKAIGIERNEMTDYIKEFKKAIKDVIYG